MTSDKDPKAITIMHIGSYVLYDDNYLASLSPPLLFIDVNKILIIVSTG